jgi:hypothetical protein
MFVIKEGTEPSKVGEGTEQSTQDSIVRWLAGSGFTVRTSDEDKSYVGTQIQNEVDKMFAKQKVQIEEKVKELTGIDRTGEGEKAIDYLTRAFNQRLAELPELQSKLKAFEEQGISGNEQAQEYKNQLDKLQNDYKALKEDMDAQLKQKDNEIFSTSHRNEVNNLMSEIRSRLDQNIKPELLSDIVDNRLNKFYNENKATPWEDRIIYKNGNGETITSQQDGKPMSTKELLMPYFQDIIDESRKAAGAGSNGQGGDGSGNNGSGIERPESVKTQVDLHAWLQSDDGAKLAQNTPEFSKAFSELKEGLPLR